MVCCIYARTYAAEASRQSEHAIVVNAAAEVTLPRRAVALATAFENIHGPKLKAAASTV